jgi:hypothetical protein
VNSWMRTGEFDNNHGNATIYKFTQKVFNVARFGLPFLRSRAVSILRDRLQLWAGKMVLLIWAPCSSSSALSAMMTSIAHN